MSNLRSQVVLLAISLLTSGACVAGELQINLLYDDQTNDSLRDYEDNSPFSGSYANIPLRGFIGRILQPEPRNACHYIPLLPTSLTENSSWIALVDGYPSCPLDMVENVRNAGYGLIITSSHNDTNLVVSNDLRNTQFPVAAVKEEYANYLRENAQSNSSDDPITAHVTAEYYVSLVTVIVPFLAFFCFLCTCCCLLVCLRFRRSDPDMDRRMHNIEERRRTFEQLQRQERLARQELIESILRQLQELQVELGAQVPLGDAETKRLPKRKYRAGGEVCDTCAICVDEFQEGIEVRVLPCDHVFHPKCIDEWLGHHSSLCPLCKMEVTRKPESSSGAAVDLPPPFVPRMETSSDDETPFSHTSDSEARLLTDRSRSNNSDNIQTRYGSV